MKSSYTQGDEPVPGFQLVSFLGAGPMSQVWKAVAPGGTSAALKIIRLNSQAALKEFCSIRLFKQVRHPHLVPLMAFWVKDEGGKLVDERLVGEFVLTQPRSVDLLIAMGLGDKSLSDRLRECQEKGEPGIPRDELLSYLTDAAQGIDHLNQPIHDLGSGPVAIQHCDIKPQNILIAGNAAQICDLGIARVVGDPRNTAPVGSAAYIAPELLLHSKPSGATDQYSLAISYYELRTGHLPLHAESVAGAFFTHLQGKLDLGRLPDAERVIVARATALQPDQRFPNCAAMVDALKQVRSHALALGLSESDLVIVSPPSRADVPELPTQEDATHASGHLGIAVAAREDSTAARATEQPLVEMRARAKGRDEWKANSPQAPSSAAAEKRRGYRWRVTLPLLLLAAAALGSFGAWLTRSSAVAEPVSAPQHMDPPFVSNPFVLENRARAFGTLPSAVSEAQDGDTPVSPPRRVDPPLASDPFVLEDRARGFETLASAIAEAQDGDTVTIHGNGPFVIQPLQVRGKALTIRAGPGFRPLLQWAGVPRGPFWRPLLATDRALTLEGLDLYREFSLRTREPAHLIWCQQAPLLMIDCRLRVPHGSAVLVCRNPSAVELRNCSLVAHALALCVEVGDDGPCSIRLTSNSISLEDVNGTALCVYASEIHKKARARLLLENNTVRAGQLATLKALLGGVKVQAHGNEITVGQAVLGFVGFPNLDGWQRASTWEGSQNRYSAPANWIQVDGVATGVRDLHQWQALWGSPETGSTSYPGTEDTFRPRH
jgi:serine/threonine protein kinase